MWVGALLLAGCGAGEEAPIADRIPGITIDAITTIGSVKQIEYRNAATGERYRLRASVGDAGWIESSAEQDRSESVRIEWDPMTVHVEASQGSRTEVYFAGASSGFEHVAAAKRTGQRHARSAPRKLSFLVDSTVRTDELLGVPELGTTMAMASELITAGVPPSAALQREADAPPTFPCDYSIDLSPNCGVEAKMAKADTTIFNIPSDYSQDANSAKIVCGDSDGLVRIQACPLSAYNCDTHKGAKTEQALGASEPEEANTTANNDACGFLAAGGDGYDVGRKFNIAGKAEIRPFEKVNPKDPGDEAKHPSDCKFVWEFPGKTIRVYHSQFKEGVDKDTTVNRTKFEIPLTATSVTGTNAIGGLSQIKVRVQTCQDADIGRDDYAVKIAGERTNVLYNCSNAR